MTAPESPAALLRRAADRLDELDKAASPGDWSGYSDQPADQPRGQIFCGPRDEHGYRTGSVCSWSEDDENGAPMSQEDMDLVCTLRPVAAPLAAHLRATADRWDADVILDRPESGEMEPRHPEAWWCGFCQGAIDSPDYPGDAQRCTCGRWTEALTLARAILGETEPG